MIVLPICIGVATFHISFFLFGSNLHDRASYMYWCGHVPHIFLPLRRIRHLPHTPPPRNRLLQLPRTLLRLRSRRLPGSAVPRQSRSHNAQACAWWAAQMPLLVHSRGTACQDQLWSWCAKLFLDGIDRCSSSYLRSCETIG